MAYFVRIRRKCASPKTTRWSTHSRRIDPISLSAKPFCQGEPGAWLWLVSGSPICLPVSGSTTAPYCPQTPRDDALAVATERRPPDVILMQLGKDAPLGRQIERSVTIVITPIL